MIVVVVVFVLVALWLEKPSSARPLAPVTDPIEQALRNAPRTAFDAADLGMMLPVQRAPGDLTIAGVPDPSSNNGGYV